MSCGVNKELIWPDGRWVMHGAVRSANLGRVIRLVGVTVWGGGVHVWNDRIALGNVKKLQFIARKSNVEV